MSNVIAIKDFLKKKSERETDPLEIYLDVISLSTDEIIATLIARKKGEKFNEHIPTQDLIMEARARIEILESACNKCE